MILKTFSLIMTMLILITICLAATATENDVVNARSDAKSDVGQPYGWFAGACITTAIPNVLGCIGGMTIFAGSQLVPVRLPSERLIGKSPAYINAYTKTYKKEVKDKRLIYTATGCLAGSTIAAVIYLSGDTQTFGLY